jgi:hypothetical protein
MCKPQDTTASIAADFWATQLPHGTQRSKIESEPES